MLTLPQLVQLARTLGDQRVLSVYVHGAAEDPAARLVWRTDLDRSLRDLRRWLVGSPHEEREAFERSVNRLDEVLAPFARGMPSPGWAGFVVNGVMRRAEALPVAMPTLATWSTGMCVAPYIHALKETRPVLVILIDARRVRVYRYANGKLAAVETVHAHAIIGAPTHMGHVQRAGFHPGVRGETARDAVQRAHAAGTERMLREAERVVAGQRTLESAIVVGGTDRLVSRFRAFLGASGSDHVLQLESLHADASEAEITEAAKSGGSALRDAADLRRLVEIISGDMSRGGGTVGPAATYRALERFTVRELYITSQFVEDHAAEAEDAVRQALDQGASVEQVSRFAAAALDAHGGMAALLRYPPPATSAEGAQEPNDVALSGTTMSGVPRQEPAGY